MAKNEIHARLSPEVMKQVKQLTHDRGFSTISHTVRWLLDFGIKTVNGEIKSQQKNDIIVRLIEEEYKVFFARCRDEYDPEDGQLYWFWFESKKEASRQFDSDSPNNWCPTKRFNSQGDAVKDCLRERVRTVQAESLDIIESSLLSLIPSEPFQIFETEADEVIDW